MSVQPSSLDETNAEEENEGESEIAYIYGEDGEAT